MKPINENLSYSGAFDLIEYQRTARETNNPKALFDLWERVCHLYDKRRIGQYQLDEMKATIWPKMTRLSAIARQVDNSFIKRAAGEAAAKTAKQLPAA